MPERAGRCLSFDRGCCDEISEPLLRELLGRYPPRHPYHQTNPILRYYPGIMAIATLAVLIMGRIFAVRSRLNDFGTNTAVIIQSAKKA